MIMNNILIKTIKKPINYLRSFKIQKSSKRLILFMASNMGSFDYAVSRSLFCADTTEV